MSPDAAETQSTHVSTVLDSTTLRLVATSPQAGKAGDLQAAQPSSSLVQASRARFARDRAELLKTIAQSLEASAPNRRALAELLLRDDVLSVCAWCGRVRVPGSGWLPIQQYVPEWVPGCLTHGMCGDCRRAMREAD